MPDPTLQPDADDPVRPSTAEQTALDAGPVAPGPAAEPVAEPAPEPAREEPSGEDLTGHDPRLTPDHEPFYEPWRDPDRHYAAGAPPTSHSGPALEVEKRVLGASRLVDRLQSRFTPIAFGYAVFKKYADDEGSRLAALLAYYTFLSLFPLMIAGFALLNSVLQDRKDLVLDLMEEIVPPEYQQQVIDAYLALPDSGVAFWVAFVGLLLSGTAGVFSLYAMVNQVYAVPYRFRYGFGPRYARVLVMVILMGVGVLVVAVGSTFLANVSDLASVQRIGGFALIWVVASGLLYMAAAVLTRRPLGFSELGLGAALGGLAMTSVISLGSFIVAQFIASSSAVYGAFATVIGIISVFLLVSNSIVFCFEISVVRAWQLWPRGVDINLLFPGDDRAYALLTLMDERMPSQRNAIALDATGHDDPRRPDWATLQRRPPGVPLRPYDVPRASGDAADSA
jgi:membrane protein